MTTNKTSEAVKDMLSDALEFADSRNLLGIPKDGAMAIAKKYQRMEEALKEIEWNSNYSYNGAFCPVCTAVKDKGHWPDCPAGKALSFDPLSVQSS